MTDIEKLKDKLDGLVHANRHFMDRIEQLTSGAGGIMEMKQTIAFREEDIEHYKEDALHANDVANLAMWQRDEAESRVDDLEAEIQRLRAKCDMQANILRKLTPDKFPDTLFISGVLGERDFNNMPQKLLVVPAYGVDFSYIYERTEKTTGPEW
jgi:uncharacterized small protein (DUF1192 family)